MKKYIEHMFCDMFVSIYVRIFQIAIFEVKPKLSTLFFLATVRRFARDHLNTADWESKT